MVFFASLCEDPDLLKGMPADWVVPDGITWRLYWAVQGFPSAHYPVPEELLRLLRGILASSRGGGLSEETAAVPVQLWWSGG